MAKEEGGGGGLQIDPFIGIFYTRVADSGRSVLSFYISHFKAWGSRGSLRKVGTKCSFGKVCVFSMGLHNNKADEQDLVWACVWL